MDLSIYGYFHFFDNLDEFLRVIDYILINYFGIAFGKYIILHDQIKTKNGKLLGKKGENCYLFTSAFSDKTVFNKILKDGIIKKNNCINLDEINDDEFDEFDNIKKATTLNDYDELLEYIEKNNLK